MHGGGAALTWEDVAIPVTIPGGGREEASVVALGHHHVGDWNIAIFDVAIVQLADGLHQLGDLIALDLHSQSSYVSALSGQPLLNTWTAASLFPAMLFTHRCLCQDGAQNACRKAGHESAPVGIGPLTRHPCAQ